MSRCKNCKYVIPADIVYCPCCGVLVENNTEDERVEGFGVGGFLYGPPYTATFHCPSCNYDYHENGLGTPRAKYCPHCGKPFDKKTAKVNYD